MHISFNRLTTKKTLAVLCFGLLIGALGIWALHISHATTPAAIVEAESGVLGGNAVSATDASAAGGKYIKFRSVTAAGCVESGPLTYDSNYHKICAVTSTGAANTTVFKDEVDFVVVCGPTNRAKDDPILLPGAANERLFTHEHQFIGTQGSAASTAAILLTEPSNCGVSANHTSYWAPTLFKADGTPMVPYTSRLYYRVGTMHPENLVSIPQGLELIAGNSMATATTQQKPNIAGIYCRTVGEHTDGQTAKQPYPPGAVGSPVCADGTVIAQSVVFPNCWNGTLKYNAANLAYSTGDGTCPAGMKNIPQLTEEDRYDEAGTHVGEQNMYYSSMSSPYTLHADALEAWNQPTMDRLVNNCLKAAVHCGDVTDSRLPPNP
jgi:hypothetical protein